jgi:hypothetical protein
LHFTYLRLYFWQRNNDAMAKNNDDNKGRPIQKNPEPDALEKEIEDMIEREKTKRRIVGKLLNQTNQKNKKSDN